MPVGKAVVVPAHIARIEEQVASVVAVVRIERARPVGAITARTGEIATEAIARRREKYTVAVLLTCYFITVYSILCGPCPCTVICVS